MMQTGCDSEEAGNDLMRKRKQKRKKRKMKQKTRHHRKKNFQMSMRKRLANGDQPRFLCLQKQKNRSL